MPKLITINNYQLPHWLFTPAKQTSANSNPAAQFNPVNALKGQPWQTSTSPLSKPQMKALVFDYSIYTAGLNEDYCLAIIYWFQLQGFEIYLCVEGDKSNVIVSCQAGKFFNHLTKLGEFSDPDDYVKLAHHNLSKDTCAVINAKNRAELLSCLHHAKRHLHFPESSLCQVVDQNAYKISFPHCWLAQEDAVTDKQMVDLPNSALLNRMTQKQLYNFLCHFPWRATEALTENAALLNSIEFVLQCMNQYPSGRQFIAELAYKNIQLTKPEPDYILALNNIISVTDIPDETILLFVKKINETDGAYFDKVIEAFPNLEIIFPRLLKHIRPSVLFKHFPHRMSEILAEFPITNIFELMIYHREHPEYTDELVQMHLELIQKSPPKPLFKLALTASLKKEFLTHIILRQVGPIDFCNFEYYLELAPIEIERYQHHKKNPLIRNTERLIKYCRSKPILSARLLELYGYLLKDEKLAASQGSPEILQYMMRTFSTPIVDCYDLYALIIAKPDHLQNHLDIYSHLIQHPIDAAAFPDISYQTVQSAVKKYPHYFLLLNFLLVKKQLYFMPFRLMIPGVGLLDELNTTCLELIIKFAPYQAQMIIDRIIYSRDIDISAILKILAAYPILECVFNKRILFKDCTYLYIGNFNAVVTEFDLNFKFVPNIVVLEICNFDPDTKIENNIKQLFLDLQTHCPKLQRLIVPETLRPATEQLSYAITYQPSPPNGPLNDTLPIQAPTLRPPSSPYLFVAQEPLSPTISSEKISSFKMIKTGKLLNGNGAKPHRIRTAIIELNRDFTTLQFSNPRRLAIKPPPQLTNKLIEQYSQPDGDFFYYLFSMNIPTGNPTRLLSVDAHEEIIAAQNTGKATLKYSCGTDGFYYVESTAPCEINYIIRSKNPLSQNQLYHHMDPNDAMRKIIDAYKQSAVYTPTSQTGLLKQANETSIQWFERLYKQAQGTCVERSCAVWYQIYKHPELHNRVRLVHIDNNHVRLEILEINASGQMWHQVDLGGSSNYHQSYENPFYPTTTTLNSSDKKPTEEQKKLIGTEHYQALCTTLLSHKKSIPLRGFDSLFESSQSPILVQTKQTERWANGLLSAAKEKNVPIFYLYSPSQVLVGTEQIHLNGTKPIILALDALDLFIKQYEHSRQAIILINWNAFNAQQRVALNSLIDQSKSVYGKKLPTQFKIVSLNQESNDCSFLTRHGVIYEPEPLIETLKPISETSIVIDLQGFPDWQEHFFGPVLLTRNELFWQKSDLVQLLEQASIEPLTIKIINVPEEEQAAIRIMLDRAKAKGYFEYHHRRVLIPHSINFICLSHEFDFTIFEPIAIDKDVVAEGIPAKCYIINTLLFDFLLHGKQINDGQYVRIPGWIEQAQDKSLSLFITSPLSSSQWYCLIKQAKVHRVELHLYLAKEANPPARLATKLLARQKLDLALKTKPTLYLSNHPEKTAIRLMTSQPGLLFAIEDYHYEDIVSAIHYLYQNQQFTSFQIKDSAVLQALKDKTVYLYGEFSETLIQSLHPLLLSQALGTQPWEGRLILVADQQHQFSLNFLPTSACIQSNQIGDGSKENVVIYQEKVDTALDLANSASRAEQFILARLTGLTQALTQHSILQLLGHTGVGKTWLIKILEEYYPERHIVYHELEHFEQFAEDRSDKVKILFLDEVNIGDKHLTMLDPVKTGQARPILYKGVIYTLTPQHKIVCAHNPLNYGGGRVKQKLFINSNIPELHYEDMPAYFIYEYILKPIFQSLATTQSETEFKNQCQIFLEKYLTRKKQNGLSICIRELEEWVFSYIINDKSSKISIGRTNQSVSTIIITPSLSSIHQMLQQTIEIRKRRFLNQNTSIGGLNGCLIEGRPGMGKSELIRHCLAESGYQQIFPGSPTPVDTLGYLKIDASLPDPQKKALLREAFNKGYAVWLDEVNSCLDTEFEKWVNAFLCGFDPDTKQKAKKPGFMLLVTANSINMEGRSLIGPALRGRLVQLSLPETIEEDFVAILTSTLPMITPDNIKQMSKDLSKFFKENPDYTLRELARKYSELASIYQSPLNPSASSTQKEDSTSMLGFLGSFFRRTSNISNRLDGKNSATSNIKGASF